jgi:quinolinate synthase
MQERTRGGLVDEIAELKERRNAVILTHNYQLGEVQDVGDFVGDSLELSKRAAATSAEVIVFCGVRFMAETAKILSPDKVVLLPNQEALCPMAGMVDAAGLQELKSRHPDATVVCYVNTTAEVKAECDLCCTSANAQKVIAQIPAGREIIFVPDQHLGAYARSQTDREMILWPGYCATHVRILPEHILERKRQYPDAKVVVHPECRADVSDLADAVLSTSGMCKYVHENEADTIIVGTEVGMIHRLRKEAPEKIYIPATEQAICPQMKVTELEDVRDSLERMQHSIEIPEDVRRRAEAAVGRMVEIMA